MRDGPRCTNGFLALMYERAFAAERRHAAFLRAAKFVTPCLFFTALAFYKIESRECEIEFTRQWNFALRTLKNVDVFKHS